MAITSILPTSNKVPGIFIQVTLGVGRRSAGAAPLRLLLVGNKTSAGSAAVETVKSIFSIDDARTYFGPGSELFLMAKAALDTYPGVTLFGTACTESGGNTADDDTLVIGSGPATAAGTLEVWVQGERVVAEISVGDTATNVGDAVEAAINAKTDWPVTASNTTGTVTITAKQAGPKSNGINVRTLLTGGTGLTHTAINTDLSGGTTIDDPTNCLDAVAASKYDYIVASQDESVSLAIYESHVDDAAEPGIGIRQRFFFGSRDTLANATTLSDAINAKRGRLIWHYNSDHLPSQIAAAAAAKYAELLQSDRARPLDGETIGFLTPQYNEADKPLPTELISALNNGITPLDYNGGDVFIVRAITNYSTDSSSNPDFSVLDVSKVDVPDFIADELEINFPGAFPGFKLDDDPPAGTLPERDTATPSSIKDWIFGILKDHDAGGPFPQVLQNVDDLESQLDVEIDATVAGRANAVIPLDVVEGFHQAAFDIQQTG